jgi:hypothetical protein
MRAVSQASGPKILRIGVVQGGKVIDERLIKQRGSVTIGPSEKAMFVVPTRKIPPNFRLFELIGQDYHINFIDGMTGRVALKTGISDLAALKAQAKTGSVGNTRYYRVRLSEESRGKIVIGETTFLFQFVFAPPVQPRPQLPVSVQQRFGGEVDWFTTIIAAFSFLVHFFMVALVYSDWMDPIVDEDRVVGRLVEAAADRRPPPPPVPVEAPTVSTATSQTTADATTKAPTRVAPKAAGKGGEKKPGPGDVKAAANAKAAELESELAALDVQMLGAVGQGGVNTGEVLSESNVPTGLLDGAAQSSAGAGSGDPGGLNMGSGSGSGSVKPGAGGGGRLSDIGNTGGTGTAAAAAGTAKTVKGPRGSAVVGGAGVAGGKVANASSVVARMRGRFRNCYQRGLNNNPEMAGSVSLVARIGPNGEVLSVGGGGSGGLGAIVPCLKAVVRGGGFSPPDGGSAIISIPITFIKQ